MATRSEKGVSRVLDKLEASVKSGQYYEAHQMYRTLHFRYLAQKKYQELLDLLVKGSTLLLEHDQQVSGADLALLIIEVLIKSETKPCEEWIEKLSKLFELMNSTMPEREAFLTHAVKWSMDIKKKGHPLLHKKIAEVYWKENELSLAHRHFLHSNDGAAYAKMLIELHTEKGSKSEIDLFIVQAVLQLLCLRNIDMAISTFKKYTGLHPDIKSENELSYPQPLLTFLRLLLCAAEMNNKEEFIRLRNVYCEYLKRDPNYSDYLDKIGYIWFGIKHPKNDRDANPIGGLLRNIIGDVDSSDEEGEIPRFQIAAPDLD